MRRTSVKEHTRSAKLGIAYLTHDKYIKGKVSCPHCGKGSNDLRIYAIPNTSPQRYGCRKCGEYGFTTGHKSNNKPVQSYVLLFKDYLGRPVTMSGPYKKLQSEQNSLREFHIQSELKKVKT